MGENFALVDTKIQTNNFDFRFSGETKLQYKTVTKIWVLRNGWLFCNRVSGEIPFILSKIAVGNKELRIMAIHKRYVKTVKLPFLTDF